VEGNGTKRFSGKQVFRFCGAYFFASKKGIKKKVISEKIGNHLLNILKPIG